MKVMEPYCGFEQGPIRPPSEAGSLMLRISRNCPWNKCSFCSLYKGTQFSMRPVDHVLRDIDTVRFYVDVMDAARKAGTPLSKEELLSLSPDGRDADINALQAAMTFLVNRMESIFIQDGDSLVNKPENTIRILKHLKGLFPEVRRITTYSRSATIARISDANLSRMAGAGLNRIHIGMESGADRVLDQVRKGVDRATQIQAGRKVKKAGIELSEYYIPGLGGSALSEENAIETADTVNQINPDFIRLRTLGMSPGAPLTEQFKKGDFDKMGEVETAGELLRFLEGLKGISSTVKSDHVLNLFPEVEGVLPDDREKMMKPVREFLSLDREEQMLFCVGRRTHRLSRFSDLKNPVLRKKARKVCLELGVGPDNFDSIIDSIMQRFI